MFHGLIKKISNQWYESDNCKVKNIINYIISQNNLRDAQIEAIKLYMFFKIYCKNKSLSELFSEGYFLQNINLDELPISKKLYDFLINNVAARQLYEITITNENFKSLKEEIEENYDTLNYTKIFRNIFHNISYANYIYSLPMGAGKTFLMSAFIYIDLYFAINEPYNKAFAHNFIVLAPSGLKSSIIPSLKKIKDFDVTWIFPEPIASELRKQLKFEILDENKTKAKSNKVKNPNVAKVASYQPYDNMMGVIFLTNAEKVILNRVKIDENEQLRLDDEGDITSKVANELRENIGKIPNLAIFIDEVHHVADEDIKLNKVVGHWYNQGNINEVIGFSGTPYLDSPEIFKLSPKISIKNTEISNTIYYYPLTAGIDNFLKRPRIFASSDNNSINIIKEGLDKFFEFYKDVSYNGITSKLGIYCGLIANLEEKIYPFVADYVTKLGLNPDEIILKYHGGNKDYPLPKENKLEWESLNNPTSKKRIILLVDIGKEGWDCSSLTGVILSQKGDCPTKMVLQTACRCLRQVVKGNHETALIYLNKDNEKLLSNQLNKSQHATLQEFQEGTKVNDYIKRYNRMSYLGVPEIEYYKMNIRYTEEIKEKANIERDLKKILDSDLVKNNIIISEININGEVIDRNINDIIYGKKINYNEWLLDIVKESFGFLTFEVLKKYDKKLRKIYKMFTVDNDNLNTTYNLPLINKMIRTAFYDKRKMVSIKEEVPEKASILSITDIPPILCTDKNLQYPNDDIVNEILSIDKGESDSNIDFDKLSKEELLELVKNNPEVLMKNKKDNDVLELELKDKTFHYLPYVFTQSSFEKEVLQKILTLTKFKSNHLEIYYNGDRNTASFRIECYKTENRKIKKVGLYTPDFLILRRDEDNKIDKVLIVETKGKGYSKQQDFIDRRNYVEREFIKFNNKKFGYNKFDYLYIEDTLSEKEMLSKVNDKLTVFLKEEK
ncbi:MAG: DEAD/DEAH box helicase family protein [Clostridia bacterium]|nr:DEAD/DEAH box helicase family protein [Clostridia bacterium]